MKVIKTTSGLISTKPVLSLLAVAASACVATGQPVNTFVETFTGPGTDNVGYTTNNPANHLGIIGGKWVMTDNHGAPGTELRWSPGGSAGSFESQITIELGPFYSAPSLPTDNTKADFKWRFFGPDGFVEIVMNTFGNTRVFHNRAGVASGNLVNGVNLGIADGDVVDLKFYNDDTTGNLGFFASINAGPDIGIYSGPGNGGPGAGAQGDFFSGATDFQLFKFGATPPDNPFVQVDYWDLVIPEPTSAALLGIGGLSLLLWRRRR